MKKLFTLVCALVLSATLSFAQTGSTSGQAPASGDKTADTGSTKSGKKHKGTHAHHKGGKKSKKSSTDTTPPPK